MLYRFSLLYRGISITPVIQMHICYGREAMNRYLAKTQTKDENQSVQEEAQARRMRRRHQNHSYFGTTSVLSIFTLRW